MHDPLAVAAVADPQVVRTILAPIDVETQGELTRGATVVDLRRTWGSQAGGQDPTALGTADDSDFDAHTSASTAGAAEAGTGAVGAADSLRTRVAVDVDADRFWTLLIDALQRIGNTGF